ncbi:MAG: HU family DNA-binding protein [Lachnospiraceae bacterium]|nr:HU family DNA-binding protein [Lachnospiraceae bacterium]
MNKKELVSAVAEASGGSRKDTEAVISAFTEVVGDAMKNGEKVQLVGFGTFEATQRAARIGRNPATGETMQIEASNVPKFKAGNALKEKVNA